LDTADANKRNLVENVDKILEESSKLELLSLGAQSSVPMGKRRKRPIYHPVEPEGDLDINHWHYKACGSERLVLRDSF
jgi:hypothetical protein